MFMAALKAKHLVNSLRCSLSIMTGFNMSGNESEIKSTDFHDKLDLATCLLYSSVMRDKP